MSDPYATRLTAPGEAMPLPADISPTPERIGRYRIEQVLGWAREVSGWSTSPTTTS
jgi:hypothetical protein